MILLTFIALGSTFENTLNNMLLTKCNQFNIKQEDCLNSTYLPRNEYNAYLNSFNVPIIKDDYCNEGKCVAIIYKDENKCSECRDKSCYMNCKHMIHTDNLNSQQTHVQNVLPNHKNIVVQKPIVPVQNHPIIAQDIGGGLSDCVGISCESPKKVVTITKELTKTLNLSIAPESSSNKIPEPKVSNNTLTIISTVLSTVKKVSTVEKSSISTVTVTDTSVLSKTRTTTIENVSMPNSNNSQPNTVTISVQPSISFIPRNELSTTLKTITITSTLDTSIDTKSIFKDIKEIFSDTNKLTKVQEASSASKKGKEVNCDDLIDIGELEKCLYKNSTKKKKQSTEVSQDNNVVTVTREIPTTVTVESPITLYREVTTTAISEVPIVNYKVTTFTKKSISTSTIERSVTVTSVKESYITESVPTTEYITSTSTSTIYSTITDIKTTTTVSRDVSVSTQYSTVFQSSIVSKTVTIEKPESPPVTNKPKDIKEMPENKETPVSSVAFPLLPSDTNKPNELTIDLGNKENLIKQLIDREEKKYDKEKDNLIIKTMYETLTSTIVRPQILTTTIIPYEYLEKEKSKFSSYVSEIKENKSLTDDNQQKTVHSKKVDCKDCSISKTITKILPQSTTTVFKTSDDASFEKIIPLIQELLEEKSKKTTKKKKNKKRKIITTTIAENPRTKNDVNKVQKTVFHTVYSRRKKPKCKNKKIKCINCENMCEDSEEIYQTIFKNL